MSITGDQRGENHSAGRVHRGLALVAGRAVQDVPQHVTSEQVRELAQTAGQYGQVVVTNLNDTLDVLRAILAQLAQSAERDSADNVMRIPIYAIVDASGFGVMRHQAPVGFIDRLERCVIQNPGTGTDAYLFHQLPYGFDPAQIGLVTIGQLVDYVSSANPASVIDQTSLPVLHSGGTFTVITRGGTAGTRVDALLTLRRTRG